MEPIQKQVTLLTQKVDVLHQLMDQINSRVSEIISSHQSLQQGIAEDAYHPRVLPSPSVGAMDPLFMHKDILMDSVYPDRDMANEETTLSSEVQIQRLTAQLTAAYNRIAALEEQLLAVRTH
jgi:hypothetical protein